MIRRVLVDRRVDRAPLVLALFGLILVAVFDLGTALPFNDEWDYQWVVRRLAQGHGLQLFPGQAAIALVQTAAGAAVSLWRVDPHVIRLTAIPFIAATSFALYRISRDLGADRFFSAVAAAAPFAIPVYAATVTGFMSEPYYLGLLMLAALAGCRWLVTGRGAPTLLALCVLAALQRQHAAALPPALTAGLLLASRNGVVGRQRWVWLAAIWLAVGAALTVPATIGLQTTQMSQNFALLTHPTLGPLAASVFYTPGMVGLGLIAFVAGLAWPTAAAEAPWWRGTVIPVAAAVVLVVVLATFVLPGNYLTPTGLNPITVAGQKPELFGGLLAAVKALSLLGVALLAARPSGLWSRLREPRAGFLLVLGGVALLPLLSGDVYDRYYLVCLLPWLPLAALLTLDSRWPVAGRAWALGALVLGLAVYAVGEQDYQSWQLARAAAERDALHRVPASQVFSGYEPYAVDVVLPEYERTGRLPSFADRRSASLEIPPHPRLALVITDAGDPRPGFPYSSLAPGKVVIVCVDQRGCP